MNWKHVFDGSKTYGRDIEDVQLAARNSGYRFMAFNGIVYFDAPNAEKCLGHEWHDTGLRVKNGEII